MSYCRWSSEYGECDVYVYENINGMWTTHVASRKLKETCPQEIKDIKDFVENHVKYLEWRNKINNEDSHVWRELAELGQEAGQSYDDETPGECAQRLIALKNKGFRVPQYAIDALEEEEKERISNLKE